MAHELGLASHEFSHFYKMLHDGCCSFAVWRKEQFIILYPSCDFAQKLQFMTRLPRQFMAIDRQFTRLAVETHGCQKLAFLNSPFFLFAEKSVRKVFRHSVFVGKNASFCLILSPLGATMVTSFFERGHDSGIGYCGRYVFIVDAVRRVFSDG